MTYKTMCKVFYTLGVLIVVASYTTSADDIKDLPIKFGALEEHLFSYRFLTYLENQTLFIPQSIDTIDAKLDSQCISDVNTVMQNIRNGSIWALRLIDSWGSIPAGLLYGRLVDLGNYDECIKVKHKISADYNIRGKYCLSDIQIEKFLDPLYNFGPIEIATCIPERCNASQIDVLFREFLSNYIQNEIVTNMTILKEEKCVTNDPIPFSNAAMGCVVVSFILLGCVLLCTMTDYYFKTNDKKLPPVLDAFSLRKNARALFLTTDDSKNPNVICCLNGIRCLSLMWVIFCHDFQLLQKAPNTNTIALYNWVGSAAAMFIIEGYFSVDTFFFLSGILLVLLAMREMQRNNGKLNIPLMYLHRYLRLTPVVIYSILVYLTLKYMSHGPQWKKRGWISYENCNKNWWANLFYIQNYVYPAHMCVGHEWYLAVDTQLYFVSPIILIALWKYGKRAIVGVFITLLVLWAILFGTAWAYGFSMFFKNTLKIKSTMKYAYFSTHSRTSPWLIGIMFGYLLHLTKDTKVKFSPMQVMLGWSVCFGLIATCIWSLLPKSPMTADPLTSLEKGLYISLTRIAWPVALSWLVFACVKGYSGPINSFLGHPLWQPLTRLSYSMYVFHMVPLKINGASNRSNTYFSYYEIMVRFWPDFGFTMLISIAVYLVIEAPMSNLELLLIPNRRKPQPIKTPESVLPSTTQTPPEYKPTESIVIESKT